MSIHESLEGPPNRLEHEGHINEYKKGSDRLGLKLGFARCFDSMAVDID